jgi:hypothetical protein
MGVNQKKKVKEIFYNIFNISLKVVNGLQNCTLVDAKTRALESFKQSLVESLHPMFNLLLIEKRQNGSQIGSLLQLITGNYDEDYNEGFASDDDEIAAEGDERRRLLSKWSDFKNDKEVKYNEEKSDVWKVVNFLNYNEEVKFKSEQLFIPGTNNTSIVPLILSFIDRGKVPVEWGSKCNARKWLLKYNI